MWFRMTVWVGEYEQPLPVSLNPLTVEFLKKNYLVKLLQYNFS